MNTGDKVKTSKEMIQSFKDLCDAKDVKCDVDLGEVQKGKTNAVVTLKKDTGRYTVSVQYETYDLTTLLSKMSTYVENVVKLAERGE